MLSSSVCRLGVIPGDLLGAFSAGDQVRVGPQTVCALGSSGSWHTVVTSMFMHGGWFHLIGNMWFLWIFGNNVEDAMGPVRFVLFYLLSGFAATALQVWTNPESAIPMVGASGAIGGVHGSVHRAVSPGARSHARVSRVFRDDVCRACRLDAGLLDPGAVPGRASGRSAAAAVAWRFWAHVGGFAAGAAFIFLFRNRELLAKHPYHGWRQPPSPTRSWHRVDS